MKQQNNYFLIGILSALFMVFEYLLSKQLIFLGDVMAVRLLIPMILIGYSAGNILAGLRAFKEHFEEKIFIATASAILLTTLSLHLLSLQHQVRFWFTFMAILPVFVLFGVYLGRAFSGSLPLKNVFLANGIGLALGILLSGKVFRFLGWYGGAPALCACLLACALFSGKTFRKLILLLFFATFAVGTFNLLRYQEIVSPAISSFSPGGKIVKTKNTELVRTDVIKGQDGRYKIFIDGGNLTPVYHHPSPGWLSKRPDRNSVSALPYLLPRAYNHILIIGAGGGSDIAMALKSGAPRIVGVELNPTTINFMKHEFRDYSEGIYLNHRVTIVNEEGRRYLQKTKDVYDLIVLQGVDTATTSTSSSRTTLDSYLYTREAMRAYWERLSPDGVLYIARGLPTEKQANALFQILKIYHAAKENRFVPNIEEHAALYREDSLSMVHYVFLLSKKPLRDDIPAAKKFSLHVLHFPGIKDAIDTLWLQNAFLFNVAAISDDRPFFYNTVYWQDTAWRLSFILGFLLFFVVLISLVRKNIGMRKGFLFAFLGAGYIIVEISVIEKILLFLRSPAQAATIVLASFLLFGSFGAYAGASFRKGNVRRYALIAFLTVVTYLILLNLIYSYRLPFNPPAKDAFIFLLIGPLGFVSALPFARALTQEKETRLLYAIDGIGTAAGALMLLFVQTFFGFNAGFLCAAASYLLIALLAHT